MANFLIPLYKYINEAENFFFAWLKQNPIKKRIVTPIEMTILYGLKYENLKCQRDTEKRYNMCRSTVMASLKRLETDGLITIAKKSHKNHPITLTVEGEETIETIFVQIGAFYKHMIQCQMPNDSEDNITHEYIITTENAFRKLERFAKYFPARNKK